jgi:hypothetical protein
MVFFPGNSDGKILKRMFRLIFGLIFRVFFVVVGMAAAVYALLMFFGKAPVDYDSEASRKISVSLPEKLVPGDRIPEDLTVMRSNNNDDLIRHEGRFYMAFRTAPTHFASKKTILYVLSSTDRNVWEYETEVKMGSDVREPRFLEYKGKLFLYFFQGGNSMFSFVPNFIYVTELKSKGEWTKPKPVYEQGYVVWRVKEHRGVAYMSVYYGVGLYSKAERAAHLQLLESRDGYNWKLVGGKEIPTTETSAEEGEFEFDDAGNLYATIRHEMDGGSVCTAPKNDLSNWKCKFTVYKYDSALMFRQGGEIYVIARRNVDGPYNKQSSLIPSEWRSKYYLVRYSLTRKRTTLYRLDRDKLELVPILDFPSKGDTAYAGIAKLEENRYLVINYSTDPDGFDWNWIGGQLVGSNIYSMVLEFRE